MGQVNLMGQKKKNIRKRKKKPVQNTPDEEAEEKEQRGNGKRKRKSANLRCTDCGLSMRRGSIVRHFRRVHGLPPGVKWDRQEHPEVESEVEDTKTYVFDPAEMVDFIDPEDPKVMLERKIERQAFKIELLKEQSRDLMVANEKYKIIIKRLKKQVLKLQTEKIRREIDQQEKVSDEKQSEEKEGSDEKVSEEKEGIEEKQSEEDGCKK